MRYLMVLALMGLTFSAFADKDSDAISADVTLTVTQYCSLTWDATPDFAFSFDGSGGGDVTKSAAFTANANFNYDLDLSWTDPGGSATWDYGFGAGLSKATIAKNAGDTHNGEVYVNCVYAQSDGYADGAGSVGVDLTER